MLGFWRVGARPLGESVLGFWRVSARPLEGRCSASGRVGAWPLRGGGSVLSLRGGVGARLLEGWCLASRESVLGIWRVGAWPLGGSVLGLWRVGARPLEGQYSASLAHGNPGCLDVNLKQKINLAKMWNYCCFSPKLKVFTI